ncbi:hypothetical protein QYF61_025826 [Mycteria americana]|uniref:Uncharacterized protein n=1 Tax=Mycteria americana TaxID=33587 RepID=A0AAN7N6Y3_MYCAM|nr:hypothetical protein QYF61_025826 [Mycteria americana]
MTSYGLHKALTVEHCLGEELAQDTVVFLGYKCTLTAHVELLINQYPQVLLLRAALNPFSAQPVFVLGIAPTHVQDLALGLVELHEVRTGPPLKPVKVPLDGIPSLQHVNCTTQLGVIGKLAEGALNPTVHRWRLNQFPGQPVPMLDNPFGEVKFPNIQSKPPLAQPETISSCPMTCYLGEETDPHLSTTSSQAKQPQFPQPLLIRLLLQTLYELCCPSLDTLQHLNVSLVVGSPKLNTAFESLPTHKQINTPAQLVVICKLTEGALDPFIQIIDKDVKQNWPQHRALGNTSCDRLLTGVNSIYHHSLGPAIQPVLDPAKSTPIQAMSSQFLQENAVGDCVKGFTEV